MGCGGGALPAALHTSPHCSQAGSRCQREPLPAWCRWAELICSGPAIRATPGVARPRPSGETSVPRGLGCPGPWHRGHGAWQGREGTHRAQKQGSAAAEGWVWGPASLPCSCQHLAPLREEWLRGGRARARLPVCWARPGARALMAPTCSAEPRQGHGPGCPAGSLRVRVSLSSPSRSLLRVCGGGGGSVWGAYGSRDTAFKAAV